MPPQYFDVYGLAQPTRVDALFGVSPDLEFFKWPLGWGTLHPPLLSSSQIGIAASSLPATFFVPLEMSDRA